MLGELIVVRVDPVVVSDDAVVRRTLVLIAVNTVAIHFSLFGGIVFTPPVGDSELLLAVTEF